MSAVSCCLDLPGGRVGFEQSGLDINKRAEGLIGCGKHSDGGLNQEALLKCIDESAGDGIDVTGPSVRNDLRILVETRQATTDTELRALKCAGNAAD